MKMPEKSWSGVTQYPHWADNGLGRLPGFFPARLFFFSFILYL